ncbi:MAG: tyrosine-type recombinase/integrase [Candidatus Sulfotelmatobacter sp.]
MDFAAQPEPIPARIGVAVASAAERNKLMRRRHQRGTLLERGKREKVWVGRWLEDEIDGAGELHRRRVSLVLGTKKELPTRKLAARALEQKLAAVNSCAYAPKNVITFQELTEKWRQAVLPNLKPSTQSSVRAHLTRLNADFGPMLLDEAFSAESLQLWVTRLKVAPKTVRNFISTLRMVWRAAKSWRYVGILNPFEDLKLPNSGLPTSAALTAEQAKALVLKADGEFRLMLWLLAETGIRGGELVGLHIEDMTGRNLSVKRSAWRGKLGTPKTGKGIRQFVISEALAASLRTYIGGLDRTQGLLFQTKNGKPFDNYNLVSWRLKPLLEAIGVTEHKGIGFHSLRHCNASLLDSLNTPTAVRLDRLGHTDFATTRGYTHSSSQDHINAADKLGEFFDPTCPKPFVNDTKQKWVLPVLQGA